MEESHLPVFWVSTVLSHGGCRVPEAGIQEVEYQLMVVPDSAHLLPFLGRLWRRPDGFVETTWEDLDMEDQYEQCSNPLLVDDYTAGCIGDYLGLS